MRELAEIKFDIMTHKITLEASRYRMNRHRETYKFLRRKLGQLNVIGAEPRVFRNVFIDMNRERNGLKKFSKEVATILDSLAELRTEFVRTMGRMTVSR